MALTNAERQRRYIERLKDRSANEGAKDRAAREIIRLTKQNWQLIDKVDQLQRRLEAEPEIDHGLNAPDRLLEHLKQAFQILEVDLRGNIPKRKLRKATEIASTGATSRLATISWPPAVSNNRRCR
jgi:hypothetical protein